MSVNVVSLCGPSPLYILWGNLVKSDRGIFLRSLQRGLIGTLGGTCPALSQPLWRRKWMSSLPRALLIRGNGKTVAYFTTRYAEIRILWVPRNWLLEVGYVSLGSHTTPKIIQMTYSSMWPRIAKRASRKKKRLTLLLLKHCESIEDKICLSLWVEFPFHFLAASHLELEQEWHIFQCWHIRTENSLIFLV